MYVGVTSNLFQRLYQHRSGKGSGFTGRHSVWRLVHFEMFDDISSAIAREKQLKNWKRSWKVSLIEERNPFWEDLAIGFGFEPVGGSPRPGASNSEVMDPGSSPG